MRQLLVSGAVTRPAQLLCAPAPTPLLAASDGTPRVDLEALAQSAFASGPDMQVAVCSAGGALAAGARTGAVYNRSIGVDPAARARKLSATVAAEASGVPLTATAFRDLAMPD